jgi:hypothetical protein
VSATEPRATSSPTLADAHAQLVGKLITPTTPASIDRRALMRHAHKIARDFRPFMGSYRDALTYGLKAAWGLIRTRREFEAVRARVRPRVLTPDERAASERATRRCGASYMPF